MRRLDLIGERFGRLYVYEFSHRNARHLYWWTLCDCGKRTTQCTTNLRQGKVVSCGCYKIELSTERIKLIPPRIKFEKGVASFNVLYAQYREGAKRRNILFELSKDDFKILTSGNCHYCNKPPSTTISRRGTNGEYTYNGVDRKDSNLNYNVDNCVPCCKTCNLLKMDIPYQDFLTQIVTIYEYFFKK
jgi:hypothetical protein